MTEPTANTTHLELRSAQLADAEAIAEIDAAHTGVHKRNHWQRMLRQCQGDGGVALAVDSSTGSLRGYLLGEVRAWEFGSPPTGWIYAIGVQPAHQGEGIGARLFNAACAAFRQINPQIEAVRTMVRRDDVNLQRYFRSVGFAAGPFVEMEVPL